MITRDLDFDPHGISCHRPHYPSTYLPAMFKTYGLWLCEPLNRSALHSGEVCKHWHLSMTRVQGLCVTQMTHSSDAREFRRERATCRNHGRRSSNTSEWKKDEGQNTLGK